MKIIIFFLLIFCAAGFVVNSKVTAQTTPATGDSCKVGDFSTYVEKYGFSEKNLSGYSFPKPAEKSEAFANAKAVAMEQAPVHGVDPALLVWWIFFETGGKLDSYSYSNCSDSNYDVNYSCPATGSGEWQLGYGQQFSTYPLLIDAFKKNYIDSTSVSATKDVGTRVLKEAGQSQVFPDFSVQDLFNQYQSGDQQAKYWISVLMRDPKISAHLLASALKGYDSPSPIMRERMAGWSSYYSTNWQAASNLMSDIVTTWNSTECKVSKASTATGTSSSARSTFCTKVGNATGPNPCPPPGGVTGGSSVAAASCPLVGKRVIGCGSFMSDPKYNRGACSGPNPVNRGHCGTTYGCYKGSIEATNASRRSHSIDVDAPAGETVYLPTVDGQSVNWTYAPGSSYSVAPGDGGGYGHVFNAQVGSDTWVLHLLHMEQPPLIPPSSGSGYKSGDAVTKVAATGYTHLHINIGKNPASPSGGAGWLNPEDLGMCTN